MSSKKRANHPESRRSHHRTVRGRRLLLEVLEDRRLLSFTFSAPVTYPTNPLYGYAGQLAMGDLNEDGIPDVVTPNVESQNLTILLSRK